MYTNRYKLMGNYTLKKHFKFVLCTDFYGKKGGNTPKVAENSVVLSIALDLKFMFFWQKIINKSYISLFILNIFNRRERRGFAKCAESGSHIFVSCNYYLDNSIKTFFSIIIFFLISLCVLCAFFAFSAVKFLFWFVGVRFTAKKSQFREIFSNFFLLNNPQSLSRPVNGFAGKLIQYRLYL